MSGDRSDETAAGAAPLRNRPLPRNVRLLGAASLLNDIASEMIYPLLPQFLLTIAGGSRFDLGVIEGLAESTGSLLKLWSGAWSDRAGSRKGFVTTGYLLAALARPLIGLALAPWHILAARAADRVGKGIRTAPRDALLAESTPPDMRGRAFGFHRSMDHLGAAIGPLLAAAFLLIWPGHLRALFLLALVPGLAVVGLIAWGLREPAQRGTDSDPPTGARPPAPPADAPPANAPSQPLGGRFRLFLLALVVFALGNSSDAFLLVRAGELGVPVALLPVLWCVFHVVKSAGNLLAGPAVNRLGPRPLILGGWGAYAAIYLAFAWASQAWHAWALFLAYAVYYALTEPAEKTFVTQLVGGPKRGRAFGWFHFVTGATALPASLLFGWLYQQYGAWAAFGTGAALAGVAAVLLACVPARPPGRPPPE